MFEIVTRGSPSGSPRLRPQRHFYPWGWLTIVRSSLPRLGRAAVFIGMVLCALMAGPQASIAQEHDTLAFRLKGPDRSTPQAWITSFSTEAATLQALLSRYKSDISTENLRAYTDQLAVLRGFFDLSAVPSAFRNNVGNEAVAIMIDIMNRLSASPAAGGLEVTDLSENGDLIKTIPGTDILLMRSIPDNDAGGYVVPPEMILKLPDFHEIVMQYPAVRDTAFSNMRAVQSNLTGPYFPQPLANTLSRRLDRSLWGMPVWKWLVAFLLVVVTFAANLVIYRLISRIVHRSSRNVATFLTLLGPLLLAFTAIEVTVFLQRQLIVQGHAAIVVTTIRNLSLMVSAAWLVLWLAHTISEALVRSDRGPKGMRDPELTRFVGKAFGFAGVFLIVIFGMSTLGVPTSGIITSLGIGGIGIAFAARVTIENLFAGFLLLVDRPFRIGDRIRTSAGEGAVKQIGMRSCRILTAEGDTLTIPNGALSTSAITRIESRQPNALDP